MKDPVRDHELEREALLNFAEQHIPDGIAEAIKASQENLSTTRAPVSTMAAHTESSR